MVARSILTQIFPLDNALAQSATNSFSSLFFVSIVTSTIKESVSCFDGFINGLYIFRSLASFKVQDRLTSAHVDLVTFQSPKLNKYRLDQTRSMDIHSSQEVPYPTAGICNEDYDQSIQFNLALHTFWPVLFNTIVDISVVCW